jgi:hypothetical protein
VWCGGVSSADYVTHLVDWECAALAALEEVEGEWMLARREL